MLKNKDMIVMSKRF